MNNLVEWEYTPCAIISQDGVTVLIESFLELVWYGTEVTSSQPLLEFYSNKCKSRKSSSIFTTMIFTTAIFLLVQELFAIYKFLQYTIFQRRRKVQQSRGPVVMRCPPGNLPLSCTPVFWNCTLFEDEQSERFHDQRRQLWSWKWHPCDWWRQSCG